MKILLDVFLNERLYLLFIWCPELFFSFNNCSLWSSDLQRGVQRGLDGSSAAGPFASPQLYSAIGRAHVWGVSLGLPGCVRVRWR